MKELKKIYKFFTSYTLAVVILVAMTIVTLFGTLDQEFEGLWVATQDYFHSTVIKTNYIEKKINERLTDRLIDDSYEVKKSEDAFISAHSKGPSIEELADLTNLSKQRVVNAKAFQKGEIGVANKKFPSLYLPGGMLLMLLLFVNMLLGALVHVRKRIRGIPNLISHFSIIFLLVSAFVTFQFKRDGYVAVYEGQASNVAHSYKEWQVEILEFSEEKKPVKAHVISWENLLSIGKNGREFRSGNLPFSVKIDSFLRNAEPVSASDSRAIPREVHEMKLKPLKTDSKVERNSPGCFASVVRDSQKLTEFILSGYSVSSVPGVSPKVAGFTVDGKQYGLQLVKKNWQLPYYIKLDKFIFEKYPGTDKPRNYESRITRLDSLDSADSEKVAIRMNEPMRNRGFVVFQESFGDPTGEGKYFSQFATSDNPSDKWPEISMWIMMTGLFVHFMWKLIEYIDRLSAKRKV